MKPTHKVITTDEQIDAALARARRFAPDDRRVSAAHYDTQRDTIDLVFKNKSSLSIPRSQLQGLKDAKPSQLSKIELLGGGTGLHWPDLDVSHYVIGLLNNIFGNAAWMAHLGRLGGSVRSAAKIAASRANGQKGGRPKQKKEVPTITPVKHEGHSKKLLLPENVNWLFGNIFEERLNYEEQNHLAWWSSQVRNLYSNERLAQGWSELIREFKNALQEPSTAHKKVVDELNPKLKDFDARLFDNFAEICAVVRLSHIGFHSFTALPRSDKDKTPDFIGMYDNRAFMVEVKNLRAHDCVETMMPKLFYDRKLKGAPFSNLRLVIYRSFRGTLSSEESRTLESLVNMLDSYPKNREHIEHLSYRAIARFRLIEGQGDVMCTDAITFDDFSYDTDLYKGLFNKIRSSLHSALEQYHSPIVQPTMRKMIAMRWDVPWFVFPIPNPLIRDVHTHCEQELERHGESAEILVFTDYDFDLINTLQVR